jgi:rubredoxin
MAGQLGKQRGEMVLTFGNHRIRYYISFETAPTQGAQGGNMDKWECPCGYIYDPMEGDIENNIPAETPFEDLPDDWVCPLCGAEKQYFEKLD